MNASIISITARGLLARWFAAVGMSYLLVASIVPWINDADAAHALRLSGVVLPIAVMSLGWSLLFSMFRR